VSTHKNLAEKQCAISGLGQSDIGRRLGRDPLELTLDACYAAVADAGLTPADINGLSTYPGGMALPKGFTGASAYEVLDAMRLEVDWYDSGVETSGQLGSVMKACMAIAAGMADHVLCFRSVWEGSAQGGGGRASLGPGGGRGGTIYAGDYQQWTLPFGSAGAPIWVALFAQAHMDRYGVTPEQLAQIALNGRRNAGLNPNAIYRDPMSLDDYFNSRMITTPLRLFDCDVPCDGATAFVVSRRELAVDLAKPPVYIEAMGSAIHDRPSWDQLKDAGRRGPGPDLRRLQLPDHALAGGPSALRGRRQRGLRRGWLPHRPRRVTPSEHSRWPAVGGPPTRLRLPPRSLRPTSR
jgi:acetyl-CoA acetyltransferase